MPLVGGFSPTYLKKYAQVNHFPRVEHTKYLKLFPGVFFGVCVQKDSQNNPVSNQKGGFWKSFTAFCDASWDTTMQIMFMVLQIV